jgi:hypothetical protein
VAYDATTGAKEWAKRYDGPVGGIDQATSLGMSTDGATVFVTGASTSGPDTDYDAATVAYDSVTGSRLWVRRYNDRGNRDDVGFSVGVSPQGNRVFVTGYSHSLTTSYDYATVAYDAGTGAKQWVRRYHAPGSGDDIASSLRVSPEGTRVFVTGYSVGVTTSYDYATVAYDAVTGARLWVRRYNGPASAGDTASSLEVSPDGSKVFVAGASTGSTGSSDYATVAYDAATGSKQWVSRYNDPANGYDQPLSMGVSPDGTQVFVTGYGSGSTTRPDYATVAYDATTGAKQWVRRYNGPQNREDQATSLAISPDGEKVYVTGTSRVSSRGSDYATVAYSTT